MIAQHIETDDTLREFVAQPLSESVDLINTSSFKYTLMGTFSLSGRIDFISESILLLLENNHIYAAKILFRSLVEHFLKSQYIFLRWAIDKTDLVGEEYIKLCNYNEEIDFAVAYKKRGILLGAQVSESPIEMIRKIHPQYSNITEKQLKQKISQFSYKKIIEFITSNIYKTGLDSSESFIPNLLIHYSDLSSFVHGGPMAERFMTEMFNKEGYESSSEELAELTVSISAFSKFFTLIMVSNIDKKFVEPMIKFRQLLHKYQLPGGAP